MMCFGKNDLKKVILPTVKMGLKAHFCGFFKPPFYGGIGGFLNLEVAPPGPRISLLEKFEMGHCFLNSFSKSKISRPRNRGPTLNFEVKCGLTAALRVLF